MSKRIACCIPGCRRTFRREEGDAPAIRIVCRRHWRMADLALRLRYKRARARVQKINRLSVRKRIVARGEARIGRAWARAARRYKAAFEAVLEDATIKAVLGAEDAPRRKPT